MWESEIELELNYLSSGKIIKEKITLIIYLSNYLSVYRSIYLYFIKMVNLHLYVSLSLMC